MEKFQDPKRFLQVDLAAEKLIENYGTFLQNGFDSEAQKVLARFADYLKLIDRPAAERLDQLMAVHLTECFEMTGKARMFCIWSLLNPGILVADLLGWESIFQETIKNNRDAVLSAAYSFGDKGMLCTNYTTNNLERYVYEDRPDRATNPIMAPMFLMTLSLAYDDRLINKDCLCPEMARQGMTCHVPACFQQEGENTGTAELQARIAEIVGTEMAGEGDDTSEFDELADKLETLGCQHDFKDPDSLIPPGDRACRLSSRTKVYQSPLGPGGFVKGVNVSNTTACLRRYQFEERATRAAGLGDPGCPRGEEDDAAPPPPDPPERCGDGLPPSPGGSCEGGEGGVVEVSCDWGTPAQCEALLKAQTEAAERISNLDRDRLRQVCEQAGGSSCGTQDAITLALCVLNNVQVVVTRDEMNRLCGELSDGCYDIPSGTIFLFKPTVLWLLNYPGRAMDESGLTLVDVIAHEVGHRLFLVMGMDPGDYGETHHALFPLAGISPRDPGPDGPDNCSAASNRFDDLYGCLNPEENAAALVAEVVDDPHLGDIDPWVYREDPATGGLFAGPIGTLMDCTISDGGYSATEGSILNNWALQEFLRYGLIQPGAVDPADDGGIVGYPTIDPERVREYHINGTPIQYGAVDPDPNDTPDTDDCPTTPVWIIDPDTGFLKLVCPEPQIQCENPPCPDR